ncbi:MULTISPECIES: ATP-binding protein [unclassified Methanoculleus]|uniref:ATP-binding protein n=1 Tax=unclassified Methanoculleus TaxID=2619537 RepID=UPI003741F7B7
MKKLHRLDLQISDEIEYLSFDATDTYWFFQLASRRYEGRLTIFTSDKTFAN